MTEKDYRKAIFICRAVTVISAIIMLVFITALSASAHGDMSWVDGLEFAIRATTVILSIGVFLPPFLILYFQSRLKN